MPITSSSSFLFPTMKEEKKEKEKEKEEDIFTILQKLITMLST